MSNAQHLFYLVLSLKQEAQRHKVYINCFHISGDRMIASGIDGLPHDNYDADISLGFYVCQFMPLNISAWDIAGNVLAEWCKEWMGNYLHLRFHLRDGSMKDTIQVFISGLPPQRLRYLL
jgi:hypothetical protein